MIAMHRVSRFLCVVALTAPVATIAHAQVAPIKPGLWQIKVERDVDGQKAPDMSEHLKNMPPEQRAQMEAMLKQRGVDVSGNVMKVCQTREMLDTRKFVNPMPDCKTTFSTQNDSAWKSHTSCGQLHLESDSEVLFANSENYSVKTVSVTRTGSRTINSNMTRTAKWLSSECGDIKPPSLQP